MFFMIKQMIQLRVTIISVIYDEGITKPADKITLDINGTIWNIFEGMMLILQPLAKTTGLLGMENTPTLSSVHVLLLTFTRNLAPYV